MTFCLLFVFVCHHLRVLVTFSCSARPKSPSEQSSCVHDRLVVFFAVFDFEQSFFIGCDFAAKTGTEKFTVVSSSEASSQQSFQIYTQTQLLRPSESFLRTFDLQ